MRSLSGLFMVSACILLSQVSCLFGQAGDAIEIKPLGTTSEEDFLIFVYQDLRSSLSTTLQDRSQRKAKLAQLRDSVNLHHEYIKDRKIDGKIQEVYAGLLTTIDACSDYL